MNETLLIALIAAGSALLGTIAGQFGPLLQHWLARRHNRRDLLRARYEELTEVLMRLTSVLENFWSGRNKTEDDVFQCLERVYASALLYFPEFERPVDELLDRVNTAVHAVRNDERHEGAMEEYSESFHKLTRLLKKHAERYV